MPLSAALETQALVSTCEIAASWAGAATGRTSSRLEHATKSAETEAQYAEIQEKAST